MQSTSNKRRRQRLVTLLFKLQNGLCPTIFIFKSAVELEHVLYYEQACFIYA